MNITLVVGARPNFMKAAPVLHALDAVPGVHSTLVHTGQHYDERMSDQFLRDLELRQPDVSLGVGSGSHAAQTAAVLVRFEEFLNEHPQDIVVVVGDVNSTVAAAMAAVKLQTPVAHVESGLRSFDRSMPEEINRLMTDAIAALLFVTEPSGARNLKREGVSKDRIHLVGNTMIDTLLKFREQAEKHQIPEELPEHFALVTLHRPSNVDDCGTLSGILDAFDDVKKTLPLVWPVHPRTQQRLEAFGLESRVQADPRIRIIPPSGYLEFLNLMQRADLILTDSGGIQEEALILKTRVVTLRENTERPCTIECGGNVLAGSDPDRIRAAAKEMLRRDPDVFQVPEHWDGRSGQRVARRIADFLERGGGL